MQETRNCWLDVLPTLGVLVVGEPGGDRVVEFDDPRVAFLAEFEEHAPPGVRAIPLLNYPRRLPAGTLHASAGRARDFPPRTA